MFDGARRETAVRYGLLQENSWLLRYNFALCGISTSWRVEQHGGVVCVDAAREAAAVSTARRLPRRRVLDSWVPGAHARPARKAGGGGA